MKLHRGSGKTCVAKWLGAIVLATAAFFPATSQAAFHLWKINEVYTNSTGTLQFIELTDTNGGQSAVGGHTISVSNSTNTLTNTFTLPNTSLTGNTLNHSLLFATAGVQAAGGPAPDYILPSNFLFSAGGTINFFGQNSGIYTALPTDGTLSRTWTGGNATNSPTDYAGQTGQVIAPEPATVGVGFAIGGICLLRRRNAKRAAVSV